MSRPLLPDERDKCGDAGGVVVEFLAESFAEKFFFGADADLVADEEEDDGDDARATSERRRVRC